MTFYRHFILEKDFEVSVATTSPFVDDYELAYTPVKFDLPAWWRRLMRTRFHFWLSGFTNLYGEVFLPKRVEKEARRFAPDIVFTMAGSWDWTALAAKKVARNLGVPLAASFNDWYDYPQLRAHERQRVAIESRFRRFYLEADLALCTSEGMKEELGAHPNAHVWYPCGARRQDRKNTATAESNKSGKVTVLFAGNLGEWYGPMLERLVSDCEVTHPQISFRIFGGMEKWSAQFHERAKAKGIFGGLVNFDRLEQEAQRADILLLPMGFESAAAHIERTSFKTKFLDYLTFGKPIVVWGPNYSSAVRVAQEFDSAECVTDSSPAACAAALVRLAADTERREQLLRNAEAMYDARFNPDKIHQLLVERIKSLCARGEKN